MPKGIAQFTITDFNDVNISTTAPVNPSRDQLWLDSSVVPNQLKRFDGSKWVIINETTVGGRNLILKSKVLITTTSYFVNEYILSENFNVGEDYTFVIKGAIPAGQKFGIWQNGGTINVGYATKIFSNGVTYVTFKAAATTSGKENKLSLYNYPSNTTSATVEWVALYKGNTPLDWTMAPEDIDGALADKASQGDLNEIGDAANTALAGVGKVEGALKDKADKLELAELEKTTTSKFTTLNATTDGLVASVGTITEKVNSSGLTIEEIKTYFDFKQNGLTIGKSNSPLNITISNQQMDFVDNGKVVAYVNGQKMYISSLEVLNSLVVGVHKLEKYDANTTLIRWVGGN